MNELYLAIGVLIVMGFLFYLFNRNSNSVKPYNKIPGREIFIDPNNYNRFIVISGISPDSIRQLFIRYSNIANTDSQEYSFSIKEVNSKVLIECERLLPQWHYYNLVCKLSGKDSNAVNCFAYSESVVQGIESSIFRFDDDNPAGDTLIGVLGNGEKFFISITDLAAEVTKNIDTKFESVDEFLTKTGFDELANSIEIDVIKIEL